MKTAASSFYEATVERPERPSLSIAREEATVCIVGGGFAGLATALGLVERGMRDIVILEAQRVGFGASGRNGGFVFGGYSLECADLLRALGPTEARALYRLTLDAVGLIGARIVRHGIECDVVNAGVILADWFGRPDSLAAQRELMRTSFGVEWEPISPNELSQRLKTDRYHGGLLERNGFHFHPLKYALGIAKVLTDAGVRIYERSAALRIARESDRERNRYLVSTPKGSIEARHVVMAGGGYARGLYRPVERAVLPIATYVAATEPLGARLGSAIDCAAAVYDTRFSFDYYRALRRAAP